jgi:hypothetical protein
MWGSSVILKNAQSKQSPAPSGHPAFSPHAVESPFYLQFYGRVKTNNGFWLSQHQNVVSLQQLQMLLIGSYDQNVSKGIYLFGWQSKCSKCNFSSERQ